MDADNLRDHLREVDAGLQGLSFNEKLISELMQLPHNLHKKGLRMKAIEHTVRIRGNLQTYSSHTVKKLQK